MILVGDWAIGDATIRFNIDSEHYLINLEGPVKPVENCQEAPKAGPHIFNRDAPSIPDSKITCVLANNHLMDYGKKGLDSTIDALNEKGIKFTGAGANKQQSSKPLILNEARKKIGIISCCEAQFGVATDIGPGVNEFDPSIYLEITNLKKEVDFLILSVHAGLENMPLPSPYIRNLYESFIDAGADIVHGHHSHIPQGFEKYKDKSIYYGLGNFAAPFSKWRHNKNATWSYGVKLDFDNDIPTESILFFNLSEASDKKTTVEISNRTDTDHYLEYLEKVGAVLANDTFFQSIWHEIALSCFEEYGSPYLLSPLKSMPSLKKQITSRIKGDRANPRIPDKSFLLLKHLFSCESHRQMLITALAIRGNEIANLSNNESRDWLKCILK